MDVPEKALLWLDPDVARWLHAQAQQYYGGDVGRAMNDSLRAVMAAVKAPEDPWAAITTQAGLRNTARGDRQAQPGGS